MQDREVLLYPILLLAAVLVAAPSKTINKLYAIQTTQATCEYKYDYH